MVTLVSQNVPKMGRRMRRPTHSHHIRARAFQIQPFMAAPVLAGETLKNLLLQARVVTDPIKNPLIGWWQEYYYFYVKLTDIDFYQGALSDGAGGGPVQASYVAMLLNDPGYQATDLDQGADDLDYYIKAGQQPYIELATNVVVDSYFRDEADMGVANKLDGQHLAMINNATMFQSAVLNDNFNPAQADPTLTVGVDDVVTGSEVEQLLRQYELLKANGLTNASYEDYLESFGVSQKAKDPHRPELLRYVRQWSYPSNTIDPTNGTPRSAVSWSIQERADKDRFFKEPGLILGLTVSRPKVYLSNQSGNGIGWLDRAQDWLPAALWGEQLASMKKYAQGTGPLSVLTDADGYWVDMADLFHYGDQFVNFALTATDAGLVALPTAGLNRKFPADADIDALFVTPASAQYIRQDGITQLTVASSLRDNTPTT